jgi:hypothetical protein
MAIGNISAAEATLVVKVSIKMQPKKTTARAIWGLSPPMAINTLAIIPESPLLVTAASSPMALAILMCGDFSHGYGI